VPLYPLRSSWPRISGVHVLAWPGGEVGGREGRSVTFTEIGRPALSGTSRATTCRCKGRFLVEPTTGAIIESTVWRTHECFASIVVPPPGSKTTVTPSGHSVPECSTPGSPSRRWPSASTRPTCTVSFLRGVAQHREGLGPFFWSQARLARRHQVWRCSMKHGLCASGASCLPFFSSAHRRSPRRRRDSSRTLRAVQRDVLPANLAHYRYDLQVGPGEYDRIRVHRVVKEQSPGKPGKLATPSCSSGPADILRHALHRAAHLEDRPGALDCGVSRQAGP